MIDNPPPVGAYDINVHTIGEVVKRKNESGLGNPLLASLKAKRNVEAPFTFKTGRFEDKKITENEAFLGPGYYEYKDFIENGKSVLRNAPQLPQVYQRCISLLFFVFRRVDLRRFQIPKILVQDSTKTES